MKDNHLICEADSHEENQITLLENYFRSDQPVGPGDEGSNDPFSQDATYLPDDSRSRKIFKTIHAVKELIAHNHKVHSKRGKYHRYSLETKEEIARYAVENGTLAAKKLYREKLGVPISESTVRNFVKHHAYFSPAVKIEVGRYAYEFGLDQAIEYFSKKLGYPLTRGLAKKLRSEYLDLKSVNERAPVNTNPSSSKYSNVISCGSLSDAVSACGFKPEENRETIESCSESFPNYCGNVASVSQSTNEHGDCGNIPNTVAGADSCIADGAKNYNCTEDLSFGDLHLDSTNLMSSDMAAPCVPLKSAGQSFSFYMDKTSSFTLRSYPTNLMSALEHSAQGGSLGSYSLMNIENDANQLSLIGEIPTDGFSVVDLCGIPCTSLPFAGKNDTHTYPAETTERRPVLSPTLDESKEEEVCGTGDEDPKYKPRSSCSRRGNYVSYSPRQRAEIGKYAAEYGNALAIQHFRKTLGHDIPESTVRGLKDKFLSEKLSCDDVSFLGLGPRGRPMRLGKYDKIVQECVKQLIESGEKVNSFVAIATAREVICQHEPSLLDESGGPIKLTESWAKSFLKRVKISGLKNNS